MQSIIVIGNGQLGHMLRQAGELLGIVVYLVNCDNSDFKNIPSLSDSVIIAEIEHWPSNALTEILKNHVSFVNKHVFSHIVDRLQQKKMLDDLKIDNVPWLYLSDKKDWDNIFDILGKSVIIKRRLGGYDGHGQYHINPQKIKELSDSYYGKCIVEKNIHFINEVSLIGARNREGKTVFYPLTNNLHLQGILRISSTVPKVNEKYQKQAENILNMIMQYLDYIGVMTMECFITPKGLLINELAPRVHNSGHWTQNGASISQFELHLRSILNLALPQPIVFGYSVMINLIGILINFEWLKNPALHLHWYNKKVLNRRKVGHLNITDFDPNRLKSILKSLISELPKEYSKVIQWAMSNCVS
ncbi:5-(carboxyamino)imidazole ribonucleotide synthase [Candidatus Pantoea edessiphila]|uniref:5-(Carboxyamino)imidazole ribonucleotide synthase n=1 Tax=Candidatus Pantoea edessiphila TaxID=2044610 RepID=A0A2P5SXK1_9GAMM|nr:5-(carboxyamino)imidazole ribonucleotide synthase [Candidatus Pantoea edessiphila]MBK4775865.1 5-(carboxyamino)imidazole ribonucleotide synthase [Pantoea sp. Edef]PPI87033.1 5-(carboxyamino)imidazole ribonucleotide synthase [Candidatus Pantoea edessiphila]